MRRPVAWLLVATLAALVAGPAVVRAQDDLISVHAAHWGTDAAPEEAAGGDRGVPLSVTVHNVGTADYNSAVARLLPREGILVSVPGGDVATLSRTFPAGSAWEATFHVDLADDAKAGDVLDVHVEVTVWKAGNSDRTTDIAEVRVTGRTEVGIAPADPLLPGGASLDVPIRVVNDGDGSTGPVSLVLRPAAGSGLLLTGDDAWTTDALGPGASTTLDVRLRTPTARGPHALVASLSYVDASGAVVEDERTVAFQVSAPARGPLRVALATPGVVAGANATLEFTLTNSASGPVERIRLEWATPPGTALSTTGGGALGAPATLAAGASGTATLPVLAALTAEDLAEVRIAASYVADGAEHEDAFDFAVPILQAVRLRILSMEVAGGDLSGVVVNAGTGTAWNPRVRAGTATAVLSEDLAPNDPVSFRLPAAGASAGIVTLEFDWNDERGQVHSASASGEARAVGAAPDRALPSAAGLVLAALGAAALLARGAARGRG